MNRAVEKFVLPAFFGEPAYVPEPQREWTGDVPEPQREWTGGEWTGGTFIPASQKAPSQPWQHSVWHAHPFETQQQAGPWPCRRELQPVRNLQRFFWHATRGGNGVELADWFQDVPLAPIGLTNNITDKAKVEVVERCCLDSLRKTEGQPCLIVMATEGVLCKQNNGSALEVLQRSDLGTIMEATVSDKTASDWVPLPKHGGYYARKVLVHHTAGGSCESAMVLMRTLWRTGEVDAHLTQTDSEDDKTRLLNVLHKCRAQGHTELVFGAWGLLEHTSPEEMVRISELLRDAVLGSVVKGFTNITFALSRSDARFSKVLCANGFPVCL
jgi:hypothetical protein